MIPSDWGFPASLPLTANGKVDRKALPPPDTRAGASAADARGPASELEERLLHIWQEVLSNPAMGVDDDFFELGGHSLSAIQILSRLELELGILVELRDIFEHSTVAGLAAVAARAGGTREEAGCPKWTSTSSPMRTSSGCCARCPAPPDRGSLGGARLRAGSSAGAPSSPPALGWLRRTWTSSTAAGSRFRFHLYGRRARCPGWTQISKAPPKLALRSLLVRRVNLLIGAFVVPGTLLLVVGGTVLSNIERSMSLSIVETMTGHVLVWSKSGPRPVDPLVLFSTDGTPRLEPIPDFPEVERALLELPGVRAVVPLGFSNASFRDRNLMDRLVEQMRRRCTGAARVRTRRGPRRRRSWRSWARTPSRWPHACGTS